MCQAAQRQGGDMTGEGLGLGGGDSLLLCARQSGFKKKSAAEERCGKCDHSFNLKLSGVNKEWRG